MSLALYQFIGASDPGVRGAPSGADNHILRLARRIHQ